MDITILGSGAAYPRPGSACAGFLLRTDSTSVWMEAGNGSFPRLTQHMEYRDLDAVVISHEHADHTADMVPFMYALGYDGHPGDPTSVWAPPPVEDNIKLPLPDQSRITFERVFKFNDSTKPFEIGDIRFEPFITRHPVITCGYRVTDGSGLLVYTGDTAYYDELANECEGADILIADSTYVKSDEAPDGIHMWAEEAGKVAAKAAVKKMLLTHVWGSTPVETAVSEAASVFHGELEMAREGHTYKVASSG